MWPTHCVENSHGAQFHPDCPLTPNEIVVDKGTNDRVDSYSGFGSLPEVTNLQSLLDERHVKTIYCVGLAYDYCVGATAADGANLGYKTYLVRDATKSVAIASEEVMSHRLSQAGVIEVTSD
jgi:nicotinamidase/pyrazinamidase